MQGSDSFRLIVRRGPQPNQSYDLTKDTVTLGRDITNDITINDPEASRHHMRMTRGAGGYTIEDLGSTNGTFVNGQRIVTPRLLRPGDMIGLGETVTLAYEMAGVNAGMNPAPAAPVSPSYTPGAPAPGFQPQAPVQPPPAQPSPSYGAQPPQAPYGGQPQPQSPYSGQQSGYNVQPNPYGGQPGSGQPASPSAQSQPGYNPNAGYNQAPYNPNAGYNQGAYGASSASMPPTAPPVNSGYGEYDPYAVREDEQRNTLRWVLIGCLGLSLFCCCGTIIGAVVVDQLCLWESIPVVSNIVRALGYSVTC